MTAAALMTELIHLGFRLEIGANGIRVSPSGKLTDAQRQSIRDNKAELLALLRVKETLPAQVTGEEKQSPTVAAPAPAAPRQTAISPEPPAPVPTVLQVTEPTATAPSQQLPAKPALCSYCRPHGYPICVPCTLASDPGLELHHGVIYRTSYPPEPIVTGWHRCESCNKPYEGIRPPFGTPKLCSKCHPAKS